MVSISIGLCGRIVPANACTVARALKSRRFFLSMNSPTENTAKFTALNHAEFLPSHSLDESVKSWARIETM